jgi:15-hydroxyprostaglandin dehydrogenase (NAD)
LRFKIRVDSGFSIQFGPIYTCMEALEYMGKHKGHRGGIILNIALNAGLDGVSLIPIYASTKHALVGFSKSLIDRKINNMSGVKIICLCPAVTKTPMSASEYSSLFPELSDYMKVFRAYDTAQRYGNS